MKHCSCLASKCRVLDGVGQSLCLCIGVLASVAAANRSKAERPVPDAAAPGAKSGHLKTCCSACCGVRESDTATAAQLERIPADGLEVQGDCGGSATAASLAVLESS